MAGASLQAALLVNLAIGFIKMIVGLFTQSAAMISEAIHSFADTLNQILLAFGIRRSKKYPDPEHPFGYSKVQFFWAFIVAILIFGISGTLAFQHGLEIILNPHGHHIELDKIGWNILVLVCAMFLEFLALRTAYSEAKTFKDKFQTPTILQAIDDMQDPVLLSLLVEDSLALVGLSIAFIGTMLTLITQQPIIDGYTSMVIGLVLMVGGLLLARENKTYLVGKAVSDQILNQIKSILKDQTEIVSIKSIKTMLLGPSDMILALDLTFKQTVENPASVIDKIEKQLAENIDHLTPEKIFIEIQ